MMSRGDWMRFIKASNVHPDLDLDQGWSIGELAFAKITARMDSISPKHIMEFGAGRSSIRLAQRFPSAQVVSLECSRKFFEQTEQLRLKYRVVNLEIIHAPLRRQWWGFCHYQSYSKTLIPQELDVILIDGPPGLVQRGREVCLYQTFSSLRTGGLVFLDDVHRVGEQRVVRNWLLVFKNAFIHTTLQSEQRQLAFLEKLANVTPRWFAISRLADNIRINLSMIKNRPKLVE